jgi:hypothetical protein
MRAFLLFIGVISAQQIFKLQLCGTPSTSPLQFGWTTQNKTFQGVVATNLEDGDLKAPVGNVLNCPGAGNDCHSWGAGFNDVNGVVHLNGSWTEGFVIESWPLPFSPTGPHCEAGRNCTAYPYI